MGPLAALLALSDVLLAVFVFVWLARPEAGAGVLARLSGRGRAWAEGELAPGEEERLLWAAALARGPLLLALLSWSVAVGVVLATTRLR